MKNCNKCNNEIPSWIKINDKWCNLGSRKFCLKCSPYKAHNTQNLSKNNYQATFIETNNVRYKLCGMCNSYVELNSENYYITKNKKCYSYCKKCGLKRTIERQREIKKKCIDYLGGKCQLCGYDKYFGSLHFHHKNPHQKEYGISKGRCYNFEKLKMELDKCQLVCSNCHGEIHAK